jgi:hypothetical protein
MTDATNPTVGGETVSLDALNAWIDARMDHHRADRSEAMRDGDEYSQAAAVNATLELLELRGWLNTRDAITKATGGTQ